MGREKIGTGRVGEKIAAGHLRIRGYRIIHSNFRTPFGEIDFVARHKGVTVFVEVKSRITSSLGPPYLAVTRIKERHIIKNALFYMKMQRIPDAPWRIDVVSVKMDGLGNAEKIELFENAVEDDYV